MSELKEIRERALVSVRDIVAENKDKIQKAYELVMRLEYKARYEGLLVLDYEVGFIPLDMPLCEEIGKMVRLVTDGMAPQFIAELMTIKFLSENYQGLDALLYFLYARGILMIQEGENPCTIENLFNAVLPSDILSFNRQCSIWEEEKQNKIKNVKNLLSEKEKGCLKNISNQLSGLTDAEWNVVIGVNGFYGFDKIVPYLDKKTQELVKEHVNESRYSTIMDFPEILKEDEIYQIEAEFEAMLTVVREKPGQISLLRDVLHRSDEEMQELIRELDNSTMVLALKGENDDILERFFSNMSLRLKYETQEDIEYTGPVRRCDVEEAQREVRKTAEEKLGWQWKEK